MSEIEKIGDILKNGNYSLISIHKGIIIRNGGSGERNAYEIWKNDNSKIVKMVVLRKGDILNTLFDHDDLAKVLGQEGSYSISGSGYVMNSKTKKYLHHIITGYNDDDKKQKKSVDHINNVTLDNRKENLRIVDVTVQANNLVCIKTGVKKWAEEDERLTSQGITRNMLRTYIHPIFESNKEYFVIDDHPAYKKGISLNNILLKRTIKSTQALWIDSNEIPRVPFTMMMKLEEINKIYDELNSILKESNEKDTLNIEREETDIIKKIMGKKTNNSGMIVYKYSLDNILVNTYASQVEASKDNGCKEITIRRAIDDGKPRNGFYYRKIKI